MAHHGQAKQCRGNASVSRVWPMSQQSDEGKKVGVMLCRNIMQLLVHSQI